MVIFPYELWLDTCSIEIFIRQLVNVSNKLNGWKLRVDDDDAHDGEAAGRNLARLFKILSYALSASMLH